MTDEDLVNLLVFLTDMQGDAPIEIGPIFRCHASELKKVVGDAMRYRAIKAERP